MFQQSEIIAMGRVSAASFYLSLERENIGSFSKLDFKRVSTVMDST